MIFSVDCVTTIEEANSTRLPPVRFEKPIVCGVADDDGDAAVIDAEQFGADVGDARARTADVGMARGDDDVAVLGDVDLREDSPPALNQKPDATPLP